MVPRAPEDRDAGRGGGWFGWRLAAVPDANGDGREDLVIGAHVAGLPPSPSAAGRAYIYYLGPETITTLIESFYWLALGRAPE
ncbi:MAG TPA: FG-GAP repeat protein [Sumerlaeia bacterium]|nr:FG-GAP repeat protein [Sumerlaeia bacterium]